MEDFHCTRCRSGEVGMGYIRAGKEGQVLKQTNQDSVLSLFSIRVLRILSSWRYPLMVGEGVKIALAPP